MYAFVCVFEFAVSICWYQVTHWIVHHDGFTAETPGGETVDDIEFEDGEYYGYDEKAESETSIKSIETRVVLSKGGKKKKKWKFLPDTCVSATVSRPFELRRMAHCMMNMYIYNAWI